MKKYRREERDIKDTIRSSNICANGGKTTENGLKTVFEKLTTKCSKID